jgi:hypothetical protein
MQGIENRIETLPVKTGDRLNPEQISYTDCNIE